MKNRDMELHLCITLNSAVMDAFNTQMKIAFLYEYKQ